MPSVFCLMGIGCFPKMGGSPKSSILMEFSVIDQELWDTPIFGNPHMSRPSPSIGPS